MRSLEECIAWNTRWHWTARCRFALRHGQLLAHLDGITR